MPRPVVAIVTGLTQHNVLVERSFAPLRRLKAAGGIDRILYVTWDDPALDMLLTPLATMPDVDFVRIPQPEVTGIFHEKSFKYQRRNFLAALEMVTDPDALIVKLRPDFIFDDSFLAAKIQNFDSVCAPSDLNSQLGVSMPPSPFKAKIWVPWADGAQPFFFEDGAFIGLRSDVAKLQPDETEDLIMTTGDVDSDWSVHVLRYIGPFLNDYPMLRLYLSEFRYFVKDTDYRRATLPVMIDEPYFWCLIVISAWIMATNFHIDCGTNGELQCYSNRYLATQIGTPIEQLPPGSPYDAVENWRQGQLPGGVTPCVVRLYARLMDDSWQTALFNLPELRDLTRESLFCILESVCAYNDGILNRMESAFYSTMHDLYEKHWLKRAA